MPDFDSCLNEVCESVISEVLSTRGRSSSSWWLAQAGFSFSDCSRRPQDFDDALVELFQPLGALLIEDRILTRFYRGLGAKYRRSGDLHFSSEVTKARRLFEELGNSPATSYLHQHK
jgi:hypothetical protein